MHGVLDLIKMIAFLVEGQIMFLKHCKALLLFFSNDCDYILLPNSDEFIGFLGVLLPTQKETSIQTESRLNWYYSINVLLKKSIPKFQCLDYHSLTLIAMLQLVQFNCWQSKEKIVYCDKYANGLISVKKILLNIM